jgi:hypothetical protein
MTRFVRKVLAGLVFAGAVSAVTVAAAADEDKPGDKAIVPPAKVDWSKFATASETTGTIVKATESGFTLRVSWLAPTNSRTKNARPKEMHADHELTFAEGGLVRWKKLPPKIGVEAKERFYTPAEQTKLKLPTGAPGYAAEHGDLKPGHIVQVTLVRPREIPASKATPADLKVKYAVILGEAATPPSEK